MTNRILRLPEVTKRIGLSRSAIYRRVCSGTMPKPISMGKKSVGWLESEIDEWINEKIHDRNLQINGGKDV